ncbi:MAG TPA: hypothetical protein VGN22_08365 [Pseudonocardia sp.]
MTSVVLWTFNNFDLIWLMTQGGPGDATAPYVMVAYSKAIQQLQFGAGAAVTLVMVPLIAVLVVVLVRMMRRTDAPGADDLGRSRLTPAQRKALAWVIVALVGENPCNVDKVFRKIKQFGFHARQGGGVSGVEMALMDLAGKAYGVPAYALVGGQFRDTIRCYADTPSLTDPHEMGKRLLERKQRGFTMLKIDVGVDLLWDVPGNMIAPAGARETTTTMHPFSGIQVTAKGVENLAAYVETVRSIVGYDVALAADHFGHIAGLVHPRRPGTGAVHARVDRGPDPLAVHRPVAPAHRGRRRADLHRRGHLPHRGVQAAARRRRDPGGPSRPGDLRWHRRDQEAGRLRAGARRRDGAAPGGLAHRDDGVRAPRCGDGEPPRARAPRGRRPVLEGPRHLPAPAAHRGRPHRRARDPRARFRDINEELFLQQLDPRDPVYFAESTHWDSESSHDRLWS